MTPFGRLQKFQRALEWLGTLLSNDLAIDLGTTRTRVYMPDRGLVLNEPSVVAINPKTRKMVAIGSLALELLKNSSSRMLMAKLVKDGVISDLELTRQVLHYIIQTTRRYHRVLQPRVVISVPSEITQVETHALINSVYRARPSEVHLVPKAIVDALGAGLDITTPCGNMIVDIGGGTTEVAVLSLFGSVFSRSLRIAGNHMDQAIMEYLERKYHLVIDEATAEQIKIDIGSAYPLSTPMVIDVSGYSRRKRGTDRITIDDAEIRNCLNDCITKITGAIRTAVECAPPELLSDISDRGIVLTGGGALLTNLDVRIREETGLPVTFADNPMCNVVLGSGRLLSVGSLLRKISARIILEGRQGVAA